MDEEIAKLIEEYVKHIEDKESDLVSLKQKIEEIMTKAGKEMKDVQSDLDTKFENEIINEEEYLKLFREQKENILQKTKMELDTLVKTLPEVTESST